MKHLSFLYTLNFPCLCYSKRTPQLLVERNVFLPRQCPSEIHCVSDDTFFSRNHKIYIFFQSNNICSERKERSAPRNFLSQIF